MIDKISYEKGAKPNKHNLAPQEEFYNAKDKKFYTIGRFGETIDLLEGVSDKMDLLDNMSDRIVGKNKLINGNPLINQRTYVSGTATTIANQYTLDRWRVVTLGQSLTFSTTANVVTMTIPTGGIEQVIAGVNLQSGTHAISFIATGDIVCTVDGIVKANGDTFTLVGGINATVRFTSALGTGTVKLVQLEEGSVASKFEQRFYELEFALCQRYYQYLWVQARTGAVGGTRGFYFMYPVRMRGVPTLITNYTYPGSVYVFIHALMLYRGGHNLATTTRGLLAWADAEL